MLTLGTLALAGCRKPSGVVRIEFTNLSSSAVSVFYKDASTGVQSMKVIASMDAEDFKETFYSDELGAAPYAFFTPDSIVNNTGLHLDKSAYNDLLNWRKFQESRTLPQPKDIYTFNIINEHFH